MSPSQQAGNVNINVQLDAQPSFPAQTAYEQPKVQKPLPTFDIVSQASSQQQRTGKKRGRKLTEQQEYKDESLKKIEKLKSDLKKEGNVKERQKIRNQISA